MLRVRFNLSKGKNFMKWKVYNPRYRNDIPHYVDPKKSQIRMINCKLRNQPGTAEKIFAGADKTVCAWIDCEWVQIGHGVAEPYKIVRELRYNPRVNPFWTASDEEGNFDGYETPLIVAKGRSLFEGILEGIVYV